MASKTSTTKFFSLLISSFAIIQMARAGDPDILSDFIVPPNVTTVDASFFTFTGMRFLVPTTTFKVSKISLAEFPALNGQSVSYAVLQFPAGTPNPTHIHPRASELLFLSQGTLQVGFVDTANKLFNQTLQTGDIFVFPKGLVHLSIQCWYTNTSSSNLSFWECKCWNSFTSQHFVHYWHWWQYLG